MESNGLPLKIHMSKESRAELELLGGYVTEERGYVSMKGKGEVLTYWLLGTNDQAIKKKKLDHTKLRPLFSLPKFGVSNSVEIVRRAKMSPRMSIISSDIRQSLREKNDVSQNSAQINSDHGDITSVSLPEDRKIFNFQPGAVTNRAVATKLLAGHGRSPRASMFGPRRSWSSSSHVSLDSEKEPTCSLIWDHQNYHSN